MIRFLLGLVLFVVWAGTARHYYVCTIKGQCQPPQPSVDSSFLERLPKTLDLTAGDIVILNDYSQFHFDHASHAYTYVDGNEKFLGLVATFLQDHPDPSITLDVTGYQTSAEAKETQASQRYNNLGIARAQTIIDKLVEEYKVPRRRLIASYKTTARETLSEPLTFNILGWKPKTDLAEVGEDTLLLEQIKTSIKDITYSSRRAEFDYNSGTFEPNSTFDVYVDSLQEYLAHNTEDYLLIIGHTDSKGSESYNQELGLRRAQSVKAYLRSQGIRVPIKTQSKGELDPLVDDQSSDGSYKTEAMAQNRRVNILVRSNEPTLQERQ